MPPESLPESSNTPQVPKEVQVIRVVEKTTSGLDSWATHILGAVAIGGVLWILKDYLTVKCEKDVALFILGGLLTILSSVISYYFGSSAGSKAKNELIKNLQREVVEGETKKGG